MMLGSIILAGCVDSDEDASPELSHPEVEQIVQAELAKAPVWIPDSLGVRWNRS